ncbi:MAG: helix-turn-helix domain-containing protein [Vicinamibacterales bacterium]
MAAAYSHDLRIRVLKDAEEGLSSKELAERYHVSRAWVDVRPRPENAEEIAP